MSLPAERALTVPHSRETVLVAVRVAIHELNQTGEDTVPVYGSTPSVEQVGLPEDTKQQNLSLERNRDYAYVIAGPFWEWGRMKMGGVNFLMSRLFGRKRRQHSPPCWMITDEEFDTAHLKTTLTVCADEVLMSIVVSEVDERISQVRVDCAHTEPIEQFLQELSDQLKWRE